MSESEAPKPKPVSPEQKAIDLETGAKESPALSYYLEELAQIPPLKKQERQIIFAKLSTPAAPQARERLFQAYLRIVPPIAVIEVPGDDQEVGFLFQGQADELLERLTGRRANARGDAAILSGQAPERAVQMDIGGMDEAECAHACSPW